MNEPELITPRKPRRPLTQARADKGVPRGPRRERPMYVIPTTDGVIVACGVCNRTLMSGPVLEFQGPQTLRQYQCTCDVKKDSPFNRTTGL